MTSLKILEKKEITWWFSRAVYVSSFFHKDLVKYKYAAFHIIHFKFRSFSSFKSVYQGIKQKTKQLHFLELSFIK